MKIIIKSRYSFPEDLACELSSQIVNDDNKHAIYTFDYEPKVHDKPKVHACKEINKNGTIVISFWEEDS